MRKRAAGAALPHALAVRFLVQKIHVFFRAKTHVCCIAFLNPKPLPSKPTARMRATAQYVKIELRKTQISQTSKSNPRFPVQPIGAPEKKNSSEQASNQMAQTRGHHTEFLASYRKTKTNYEHFELHLLHIHLTTVTISEHRK